jgi:hypothetical protein
MSDVSDLSLVSTHDLVGELRKRFDCFVFLAEQDRRPQDVAWWRSWDGSISRCIGMMDRHRVWFLQESKVE